MKNRKAILGAIAIWLLSAAFLHAQEVQYLGKDASNGKGLMKMQDGQYYEVIEGDYIPGWGKVTNIGDNKLVLEHALTDSEKETLRNQGSMVYDVLEIEIPHQDFRILRSQ